MSEGSKLEGLSRAVFGIPGVEWAIIQESWSLDSFTFRDQQACAIEGKFRVVIRHKGKLIERDGKRLRATLAEVFSELGISLPEKRAELAAARGAWEGRRPQPDPKDGPGEFKERFTEWQRTLAALDNAMPTLAQMEQWLEKTEGGAVQAPTPAQ